MPNSKPRSVAKERICTAALEHFVINTYEGASLNNIAEMVGIRKASIYAHFKSKDELFKQLIEDALQVECAFVAESFNSNATGDPGEFYCRALKQRYIESIHLRFLIRTAYVPPVHLVDYIATHYQNYIDCLTDYFIQSMQKNTTLLTEQTTLYGDAYIGVVDSLHVDLLYSGLDNFERKLEAMLFLLKNAIHSLSTSKQL